MTNLVLERKSRKDATTYFKNLKSFFEYRALSHSRANEIGVRRESICDSYTGRIRWPIVMDFDRVKD